MVDAWSRWEKDNRARRGRRPSLRPIWPVVLAQDPQGWRGPKRLLRSQRGRGEAGPEAKVDPNAASTMPTWVCALTARPIRTLARVGGSAATYRSGGTSG
jgi:phosphoketolase